MATATQIAEWIIRYHAENGAPIDPISLQKMLYYAQAFRLARQGEPLFRERFKAWVHGPVILEVWKRFPSDPSHLSMPEENGPKPQALDAVPEPRLGIYYQTGICVRRMTKHPFYRMDWAEALLRPIAPDPKLPSGLFAPLSKREFLSASEL